MSKVLVGFLLCSFFFIFLISFQKRSFNEGDVIDGGDIQRRPTETPIDKLTISDYWIDWVMIEDIDELILKTNLEEKLSSEEAKEKYNCRQLFSGGFYSQEEKHIGLFVEEYNEISNFQRNPTFNSFFSLDKDGKAGLDYLRPLSARFAIQAGPMLIKNGELVQLRIKNDSYSRRIVLAVEADGFVIFVAIYNKDSFYLGPKLSELPELVKKFGDLKKIELVDAVNLDGGSHSAFLTDETRLTELSTIGSFFCITN